MARKPQVEMSFVTEVMEKKEIQQQLALGQEMVKVKACF